MVQSFNGRQGPVTFQPTDNTTGNLVLIATQTLSGAPVNGVNFLNVFNSTYMDYELHVSSGACAITDGWVVQFGNNGTWDGSGNYNCSLIYNSSLTPSGGPAGGAGPSVSNVSLANGLVLTTNVTGTNNGVSYRLDGFLKIFGAGSASSYRYMNGSFVHHHPTLGSILDTVGGNYSNTAMTDARIILTTNANNISGGTFSIYGVKP